MNFPYYFHIGSLRLHPHLILESLAYVVAFRAYVWLRKERGDPLEYLNRWRVIAAAAVGASVGSKVLYWFEDPKLTLAHWHDPAFLFGGKTIVGALIGGLIAVEWIKNRLLIVQRTGDLFAIPLCVGIAIGRIGCFLTGIEDHTAGVATTLPWGVNFGDGVTRHPTQLYEVAFTLGLGMCLWQWSKLPHVEGDIFKAFMISYFTFRLGCDFLKPDVRVLAGLSSIQCACVVMLCYYFRDLKRLLGKTKTTEPSANFEARNTAGTESVVSP